MCGICGIIGEAAKKEEVLERMMLALKHRGPDGGDAYFSRKAALGFRRLGIIDLDRGMQPNQTILFWGREVQENGQYHYKVTALEY
ncbi:MAG: hypothetical protein NC432_04885 [Roseburia sp.]|nr:hypothetical protein [Roseburia sp.]MCM1098500.1 hypothetical protein [Ruminococcus flavefaciens]